MGAKSKQDNICGKHSNTSKGVSPKKFTKRDFFSNREKAQKEFKRIASLGNWPAHIQPSTLINRIPDEENPKTAGFDAGIACVLDLIPRNKQKLSAILHAAYTPEAIEQVRKERLNLDNTETMWWAAACGVCSGGGVDEEKFKEQIKTFKELSKDPEQMKKFAEQELEVMISSFDLQNGIPFVTRNGGVQGAYIEGHELAVEFSSTYEIFFISTYHQSLGLENFKWEDEGRNSGPVHGSKQFVKAQNQKELGKVLEAIEISKF